MNLLLLGGPSLAPSLAAERLGLLVVIITATRPSGVDHVTDLSNLLSQSGIVDRIAVYDADPISTRDFPYADVIIRGPQEHMKALVSAAAKDAANDKHHDSIQRIEWRSKGALDYAYALEYGYTQRASFPFLLILEDDVWFTADFASRIREMLRWTQSDWWAWTLFHCRSFDTRREYRHGDSFEYKACTQGMLFHSADMKPFVSFAKANYREDPIDFLLRNFQYDLGVTTKGRMNVAIPSLVQHMGGGAGSTLKEKISRSKTGVCHAFDFANPAAQPSEGKGRSKQQQTIVQLPADGIAPDPRPRDRYK